MKKRFVILSLLFLFSCDDDPIRFFSLGDFRILALQADMPEIDGTSSTPIAVQITPFISDVDAAGRTVSAKIHACPDPGIALGNDPVCDISSSATQTIAYASVSTSTLGSRYTGALPAFTVNVPPGLLTGQTSTNKYNGVSYLVTIEFTAGGESFSAYKRITVSERSTKNSNPKIKNVLLDGLTSTSLKNKDKLSISIQPGFAQEDYEFKNDNGGIDTLTEEYRVSWFSYKGTTSLTRTFLDETTEFELDKGETNPFVVAILRDDRDGIDIQLHE